MCSNPTHQFLLSGCVRAATSRRDLACHRRVMHPVVPAFVAGWDPACLHRQSRSVYYFFESISSFVFAPHKGIVSMMAPLYDKHALGRSLASFRMTRASVIASRTIPFIIVWLAAFLGLGPFANLPPTLQKILPTVSFPFQFRRIDGFIDELFKLPFFVVILFGSYSLACIGWGLVTFKECPEEFSSLMKVLIFDLPKLKEMHSPIAPAHTTFLGNCRRAQRSREERASFLFVTNISIFPKLPHLS